MRSSFTHKKRDVMSNKKKIETFEAPQPIGSYSQAVDSHPWIFISGQLPLDPVTGQLVEFDIQKQVNQVLDNLGAILKASGCSFQNVVRCDIFLKDLNDFAIVEQEYGKRFTQSVPPARQTVQVVRLPRDALVEISCIARKEGP
jgi:2-iminobutanoate/2-iminopropanoate deaminase